MTHDVQIAIRVPEELVERADALVEAIAADPELSAFGRVTRSSVLRLALLRGLATLEEEHPLRERRQR